MQDATLHRARFGILAARLTGIGVSQIRMVSYLLGPQVYPVGLDLHRSLHGSRLLTKELPHDVDRLTVEDVRGLRFQDYVILVSRVPHGGCERQPNATYRGGVDDYYGLGPGALQTVECHHLNHNV